MAKFTGYIELDFPVMRAAYRTHRSRAAAIDVLDFEISALRDNMRQLALEQLEAELDAEDELLRG